jgi:hypothetical protein
MSTGNFDSHHQISPPFFGHSHLSYRKFSGEYRLSNQAERNLPNIKIISYLETGFKTLFWKMSVFCFLLERQALISHNNISILRYPQRVGEVGSHFAATNF